MFVHQAGREVGRRLELAEEGAEITTLEMVTDGL